jgi:putative FmdB family regulatory protein
MPTYEYECPVCPDIVETFQSMLDAPLTNCPKCGQAGVRRLIGRGAGIIFKGSGFYETDYRRAGAKKEGGDTGSTTAASTDAKPASPSPAAPATGGNTSTSSSPKPSAE